MKAKMETEAKNEKMMEARTAETNWTLSKAWKAAMTLSMTARANTVPWTALKIVLHFMYDLMIELYCSGLESAKNCEIGRF